MELAGSIKECDDREVTSMTSSPLKNYLGNLEDVTLKPFQTNPYMRNEFTITRLLQEQTFTVEEILIQKSFWKTSK